MARSKTKLGKVVQRKRGNRAGNWRIDFGKAWHDRYVYSFRGVPFESEEMATAILNHVEIEVARGKSLVDVLSEFTPQASAASGVEPLLSRWMEVFRKRVEVERRQPRTLREYERWLGAKDPENAHFNYWFGTSIWEISTADLEEWTYWLSKKGLSPKTVKNVLAGFSSFLHWVARDVRPDYRVPPFPWPEVDDHQPSIVSEDIQAKILEAIPYHKRGIFLAMAHCMIRPSEARALRVRDWVFPPNELRVSRAAKDRITKGEVRGLKARNTKVVPVMDFMFFDWLDEHIDRAERRLSDPDGPLFKNPDGHEDGWWSETAMRRTWGKACERAGVPHVSLYEGTKHSTATQLKALGADDRLLAEVMGHRDPRSVQKYAKLQGSAIRSGLARLRHEREE